MNYIDTIHFYNTFKSHFYNLFDEEYLIDILFDKYNEHICVINNCEDIKIKTKFRVKFVVILLDNIKFISLNQFSHIEHLYIGGLKLYNLEPVKYLKYLKNLDCNSNCIKSLEEIKDCKMLEFIDYSNNMVSDSSVLKSLPNLRYFNGIKQTKNYYNM